MEPTKFSVHRLAVVPSVQVGTHSRASLVTVQLVQGGQLGDDVGDTVGAVTDGEVVGLHVVGLSANSQQ